MNRSTLKSTGAVVAGFVAVLVLSIGTDILLVRAGLFPPESEQSLYVWWMLLLALVYRTFYGVVGGYLAARLSPSRPMRHAIILGIIGLVTGILGTIANWSKVSPSTEWYPILLIVFLFPSLWIGGKLGSRSFAAASKEAFSGR